MRLLIGLTFIIGVILFRTVSGLYGLPLKMARWVDKKVDAVLDHWLL